MTFTENIKPVFNIAPFPFSGFPYRPFESSVKFLAYPNPAQQLA